MVLLVNTFITNKSGTGGLWEALGVFQDRGNLTQDNKLDILKYTFLVLLKHILGNELLLKLN
jgi:hypothetical protein